MGQQQHAIINLNGGLDLSSTYYSNQTQPGTCKVLTNFEPSVNAGYRRINGWNQFGSATPTGGSDEILGVLPYADGVLVVAGTGIYFSIDGNSWAQLNRDTYEAQTGTVSVTDSGSGYVDVTGSGTVFTSDYVAGDHIRISGNIRQIASVPSDTSLTLESEIVGGVSAGTSHYKNGTTTPTGAVSARTEQGKATFAHYSNDGQYGSVVIADSEGKNDLAWVKIDGDEINRTYSFDTLTSDGFAAPNKPKYVTQFKQHVVAFNDEDNTGAISWSESLSNQRFDGASAGNAVIENSVEIGKALRDKLIIFTEDAIYQLVNIDDTASLAILPISYKVGCVDGWTVQEMAGDLIFLAHDGIRTLSTSDKYGDVQLGNIARKIDPIIKELLANINTLNLSSTVIRFKNQYRLFYTRSLQDLPQQLGIVGTLKANNQGQIDWQWSRIEGIDVSCVTTIANEFVDDSKLEIVYHGQYDGKVCRHDVGATFGGAAINSSMQLNEIDYGDIGTRKTLHYIRVFGEVEEATVDDVNFQIRYDFGDTQTAQPGTYQLPEITGVSGFGTAQFGSAAFGGSARFTSRILVEGSGYSNDYSFTSSGDGGSYSLNSIYVDFRIGPQH